MKFQREKVYDVFEEAIPLLYLHWKEIAHYPDIELNPDREVYFKLEDMGCLRTYTAREDDGTLVGYAVFFVKPNMHYKASVQAVQDILFIHPEKRGCGGRFIMWCDGQLKSERIQAVYHHVKKAHNFGPMLERLGYELIDLIYAKRLDKPRES